MQGVSITNEIDARKDTLKEEEAWQKLKKADRLLIAKGKKQVLDLTPVEANKEEILKIALGRTGNLRAPALQIGATMYIGFQEEMYGALIKTLSVI